MAKAIVIWSKAAGFSRWATALALLLSACAHSGRPVLEFKQLVKDGQWLRAREYIDQQLRRRPDDAGLAAERAELDAAIKANAENADFNPIKYLYAQAYIDYFDTKRYLAALGAMQQVLAYELDNEEIIEFMDKAQLHVSEDVQRMRKEIPELLAAAAALSEKGKNAEALRKVQQALALDASNAPAGAAYKRLLKLEERPAAKPRAAQPPPAPEWLEARYREAVRAYLQGEFEQALKILEENIAKDPLNKRWKRTAERIENELSGQKPAVP